MSDGRKPTMLNKSWEKDYIESVHSPFGVAELKKAVKAGLQRQFRSIAMSMFRYTFEDSEEFRDMLLMSRDTAPERFLYDAGEAVMFRVGDQIHCLPAVMEGGVNIYGNMSAWRAVPVGWNDHGSNSRAFEMIHERVMTDADSVLIRNDLQVGSERDYVDARIDQLVDNDLTVNQLQLLAKSPIVFNVTRENLLSAKNFFYALSSDKPAIFRNSLGDSTVPQIENIATPIDPALFEIYDRVQCEILEFLGIPCVPITKRAQQSVSEVNSNDDKIRLRRQAKLHQREMAMSRLEDVFGVHVTVTSVVDEMEQQAHEMFDDPEERMDGGDADAE